MSDQLGEVTQAAAAFAAVQGAFNWLVDNYPRLAEMGIVRKPGGDFAAFPGWARSGKPRSNGRPAIGLPVIELPVQQ